MMSVLPLLFPVYRICTATTKLSAAINGVIIAIRVIVPETSPVVTFTLAISDGVDLLDIFQTKQGFKLFDSSQDVAPEVGEVYLSRISNSSHDGDTQELHITVSKSDVGVIVNEIAELDCAPEIANELQNIVLKFQNKEVVDNLLSTATNSVTLDVKDFGKLLYEDFYSVLQLFFTSPETAYVGDIYGMEDLVITRPLKLHEVNAIKTPIVNTNKLPLLDKFGLTLLTPSYFPACLLSPLKQLTEDGVPPIISATATRIGTNWYPKWRTVWAEFKCNMALHGIPLDPELLAKIDLAFCQGSEFFAFQYGKQALADCTTLINSTTDALWAKGFNDIIGDKLTINDPNHLKELYDSINVEKSLPDCAVISFYNPQSGERELAGIIRGTDFSFPEDRGQNLALLSQVDLRSDQLLRLLNDVQRSASVPYKAILVLGHSMGGYQGHHVVDILTNQCAAQGIRLKGVFLNSGGHSWACGIKLRYNPLCTEYYVPGEALQVSKLFCELPKEQPTYAIAPSEESFLEAGGNIYDATGIARHACDPVTLDTLNDRTPHYTYFLDRYKPREKVDVVATVTAKSNVSLATFAMNPPIYNGAGVIITA